MFCHQDLLIDNFIYKKSVELNYTARKHFNTTLMLWNFSLGEYLKNTSKGMNLQGLQLKTSYRF
jgi:hypothetical protein